MNYQRNGLGVAIATVLALAGCGTAVEQDKGVGTSTAFHARIVDGYLAGSLVFVDSNDNGVLDAWEERAFTDRDGFVSASGSGKDYCAAGAQPTDAVHCLKVRPTDALKIRASGGYDMSTGEPFNGALSLNTTRAAGSDSTKPVVTSPLTTLLAGLDAVDKQTVITKLGLSPAGMSAGLFDADFIKVPTDGKTTEDQRKALTAAMQVQKSVEVISSFLTKAYDGTDRGYSGLGKNAALPRDASEFVYAAYAELLASKTGNLDVNGLASGKDKIEAIIKGAKDRIKARIAAVTKKEITEIEGDPTLLTSLDGRAGYVSNLGSTTAVLFVGGVNSPAIGDLDDKQVAARLRAINIAVAVARDTDVVNVPGSRVDDALNAAKDDDYLLSLKNEVDLARLAQKFKVGNVAGAKAVASETRVTVDKVISLGAIGDAPTPLSLKEGDKNDISMSFTTTTADEKGATGGTLALDINAFSGSDLFKKEASTAADPNSPPKPTSVPGTWEKLNDYSLLVTIEPIPGVKQQAVVKPTLAADGVTTKYFFDYGGKQIEWAPK